MITTRRLFMSGLTAVLSIAPISSLFARQRGEELEVTEVKVNCYGQTLEEVIHEIWTESVPVEYLKVGECSDMFGGPAEMPGWYIHPNCMIGCCPSRGPYSCQEEAENIYRSEGERNSREAFSNFKLPSEQPKYRELPELEPF